MKMWVETHRSNGPAMALYHATGGIEVGEGDEVMFNFPMERSCRSLR